MAKTHQKNKRISLMARMNAAHSNIGRRMDGDWVDKAKRTNPQKLGIAALQKWGEEQERRGLALLEWGAEPSDPSWDIQRPWWIASMPMVVMAIPRDASSSPDWSAIAERATEIIELAAAEQGSLARVTMRFLRRRRSEEDDHAQLTTFDAWSDGRMARAHCSYDISGLFESLEGPYKAAFSPPSHRREKRRHGKAPPEKWTLALGSHADSIWAAGIAPKWPITPRFNTTIEEFKAWIQSLEENGAAKARLCPNFYEAHKEELELQKDSSSHEAQKAWESLEFGMRDHLRQTWALATAAEGDILGAQAFGGALPDEGRATARKKPRI